MNITILFLVLIAFATCRQTIFQAAKNARKIVTTQSYGVVSSQLKNSNISGNEVYSFASVEDYSMQFYEGDGEFMFLFSNESITAINLRKNPYGSVTVFAPNCHKSYFSEKKIDQLACPRVTFIGKFVFNPNKVYLENEKFLKYVSKHPIAIEWVKKNNGKFHLWYFNIENIYYASGYESDSYNGNIPIYIYNDIDLAEYC